MATGNHPNDGNDEMTFNVHVAKQMTVPDEIMLTGPIGRPPSSEGQMDPPRMVVPDDITFMDTLGGKNDSIGGVLRKSEQERLVLRLCLRSYFVRTFALNYRKARAKAIMIKSALLFIMHNAHPLSDDQTLF